MVSGMRDSGGSPELVESQVRVFKSQRESHESFREPSQSYRMSVRASCVSLRTSILIVIESQWDVP